METEPKPRIHKKRRERAHRVQIEQSDTEGELEGDDQSPFRGAKERSRSKPRKKKNNAGTYEEDIIDGFAIVSFKSIEDLEKYTSGKLIKQCVNKEKKNNKRNTSISPARHKAKPHVKKKEPAMTPNKVVKSKKHNNSAADNTESSGETTDNLDTSDLIVNGPKKTINRRFSDVSTRSSSGAGYLCDSESGDERVSDTSLDIFTTKPLNPAVRVSGEQDIKPTFPPVTSLTTTITTACPVTSTTSDVTVTTVTTTTSIVSLTPALTTTTSVTITTASPTVITSSSSSHINHQHHPLRHNHQHNHQVHTTPNHTTPIHTTPNHTTPIHTTPNHTTPNHIPPNHSAIDKYSPHVKHSQKPHHERDSRPPSSPVIKRRPPTPPLVKPVSKSPPRHRAPPPPPLTSISTPSLPSSSSASFSSSLSSVAPSLLSSTSSSVICREPKKSPALTKTPVGREESRERSPYQVLPPNLATTKSFFPTGFPSHGAATPGLYGSLGPSPGLHPPLHSSPSQPAASPFPGPPAAVTGLPSLHHPHHPPPAPQTPHTPHMFAPPLPLGPPAGPLPGAAPAPPSHLQTESQLPSLTSQDLLRDDLNRRFLASQERSHPLLQNMPAFMRADIHQHMHQHQHQHQHMHQHMYHPGLPTPASAPSLVPTPTSNPYEKLPSTPLFRPGLPHRPGIAEPAPRVLPTSKDKPPTIPQHPRASAIPGLPGYPSLLLNPSAPDVLNSGIPGAFQPKGLSGLHPAVGPMFLQGRELEKAAAPPTIQAQQSGMPTTAKKPGKWCAVHVRIAWEIHHHQQKQGDKGAETKPMEPLRPPSHLMPGSSLMRPQELPSSVSSSPLLSSGRGIFDNGSHSLLNSASHLGPPFPRPSPYSIGTSLPVGIGNGLTSTSREQPIPVPSGSHEWNRLHRTPPTFQGAPSWSKIEDREKELEREREREREINMERRREEERERERRLIDQERHRFSSLEERSRERDRFRESELLAKSRSRSRSRSPMRNGRIDQLKHERPFDRRLEETSAMKVKEERRESFTREEEILADRERLLKNEYLTNTLRGAADPFIQASLVDRARMMPATFLPGERVPPHPSLWNPFDKGPADFANHRLSLQREMDQTREQLLNRFPGPNLQSAFPGFQFEQERLREEMILRDTERAKRDYLERLPMMERERLYYENSKMAGLRPHDQLSVGHLYSRNMSPALNHIKRSSPCVIPGAPPPLIHSGSSSQTRGHNSPAVNKTKGVSPTDSVGESKRDSNSNSTDPDAHSR